MAYDSHEPLKGVTKNRRLYCAIYMMCQSHINWEKSLFFDFGVLAEGAQENFVHLPYAST